MLWYSKNQEIFDYSSNEIINNNLALEFKNSIYGDSNVTDLYYALQYMKDNNITDLSVILPLDELSVNYGIENDINKEFCDKQHIHYRYENRAGGCIVFFPGNIIIHSVYPSTTFLRQHHYVNALVDYLQNKGINAFTNNNDVLINDKKIVGTVSQTLLGSYKGWIYFAAEISINADIELIDQICTKPMNKIPGSLSDYNITTEEIMEFTLNWFYTHPNDGYTEEEDE